MAVVVHRGALAVVALALGFSREPGCGGVDAPQGGTNAPCTRTSDCKGGLVCSEGVCADPDVDGATPSRDSGTGDAAEDG